MIKTVMEIEGLVSQVCVVWSRTLWRACVHVVRGVVWCGVWCVRAKPQTHPCLGPQPRSKKRRSNDKATADTRKTPDKNRSTLTFRCCLSQHHHQLACSTSSQAYSQCNTPIHVGTSLRRALCLRAPQAFVVIGHGRNMWNDYATQSPNNPPPVYPDMYQWMYKPAEYARAWRCTEGASTGW